MACACRMNGKQVMRVPVVTCIMVAWVPTARINVQHLYINIMDSSSYVVSFTYQLNIIHCISKQKWAFHTIFPRFLLRFWCLLGWFWFLCRLWLFRFTFLLLLRHRNTNSDEELPRFYLVTLNLL